MKILKEASIIFGILFVAYLIQATSNIFIPYTVIGMILLLALLLTGLVKIEMVENISKFLLDNLSILFLPGSVGLMATYGLIKGHLVPMVFIVILTTGMVLVSTGFTVQFLRRRGGNK